ncbi:MAG TPA: hypothetical protein PLZ79_10770 [Burkholderiales bacterium]|nr:hypothetical protein [Burkholderiales bacterium]
MGREIDAVVFDAADFRRFGEHVARETALLGTWVRAGALAEAPYVAGFELEAWLTDRAFAPAPLNERFLTALASALVVPELSKFNVELNGTPQVLGAGALERLEGELAATWRDCLAVARDLDAQFVMIGILPTITEADLCLANMSPLNRYHALNREVMRARRGRAIPIDIAGREHLSTRHHDVMLEAATTSFQVHLQVPASRAARYYNAALLASAPLVAACGNSPLLFGRDLWEETRVPLFEQAVSLGGRQHPAQGPAERVTFGSSYVRESLLECFAENASLYPCLLPIDLPDGAATIGHLRLHNGTIWRWNRPLIGFDDAGTPHFRIEHRVLPAGPSVPDMIANAALCFGLVHTLASAEVAPEARLPFDRARANFYGAARTGLAAPIEWLDGRTTDARSLLLEELLPAARDGLSGLGLAAEEIGHYLGIVAARVGSGRTGAAWLRRRYAANGRDLAALTQAYLERQCSGLPVHEWAA